MADGKLNAEANLIIEKINAGDREILKKLYDQHRGSFGFWAKKYYEISDDEIGEIYQKAFIALYYNVREGKLTELSSSLKIYLFSIGKNLLREQMKDRFRGMNDINEEVLAENIEVTITDKYENEHNEVLVRSLLEKIGEPCKTVLESFYFRQFSTEAIANKMEYKTREIAAKRKFICLQQLRALLALNTDKH